LGHGEEGGLYSGWGIFKKGFKRTIHIVERKNKEVGMGCGRAKPKKSTRKKEAPRIASEGMQSG